MIRFRFQRTESGRRLPSMPWGRFPWGEYEVHTVTEEEALKPYMITYNAYEDMNIYDIILLINGIADPSTLRSGDVIRLPDIDQLLEWLDENK